MTTTPSRLIAIGGALWFWALTGAMAACDDLWPRANPVTAPGVDFKVLVNSLKGPRQIVMDKIGNLLVSEKERGGIQRIVLDDGSGLNVCADSVTQLIPDEKLKHGLALSQDGQTLFASSATDVYAYPYDAANGSVGSRKTIITGMKESGTHLTRTLLVPQKDPNLLLVSHGSESNVDPDTTRKESGRSQIRVFELDKVMQRGSPLVYSSGAVLGWGLRNSVGVGEDPITGNIWSVENSLDHMKRFGQDIHNDNPGEELNFHGRPGDTRGQVYGKNFGYPSCVAIWNADQVQNYPGGAEVGKQMAGDQSRPEHNDAYCQAQTVAPRLTFPSHVAPLDIKFQDDGAAAFVSLHGSWNRQPGDGYRLSRLAFSDGMPTAASNSKDAEMPLMWNADKSKCPRGCFRPTGLLVDGSERLFMTSDETGEIYVLTGFEV